MMTRDELIRSIVDKHGYLPYKTASAAVKHIISYMGQSLSNRTRIELRGFGSFAVKHYQPKLVRNPKTGQKLQSTGKYAVQFKSSRELRQKINGISQLSSQISHSA